MHRGVQSMISCNVEKTANYVTKYLYFNSINDLNICCRLNICRTFQDIGKVFIV